MLRIARLRAKDVLHELHGSSARLAGTFVPVPPRVGRAPPSGRAHARCRLRSSFFRTHAGPTQNASRIELPKDVREQAVTSIERYLLQNMDE